MFSDLLLTWYGEYHRKLPWRETRDPYRIWLSEVMLQQTQVETVVAYYLRFLEALPTLKALAEADEELVFKLWEGVQRAEADSAVEYEGERGESGGGGRPFGGGL